MEVCTNLDRKVTRLTAEADRNGNCLEYDLLLKILGEDADAGEYMYRYKREKRIDFVMKQDDMHKR